MCAKPYTVLEFPRASRRLRKAIADFVPASGKVTFIDLALNRPRVANELLMGWAENLAPVAGSYFQEPFSVFHRHGTVRHNAVSQTDHHPWHTDAAFFVPHGRGVTFWMTLDDVGVTAPSLEFDIDGKIEVPMVPAGTALMFGPDVRHRTQLIDGPRVSVEFRCAPMSVLDDAWLDASLATVDGEPGNRRLVTMYRRNVLGTAAISESVRYITAHQTVASPSVIGN